MVRTFVERIADIFILDGFFVNIKSSDDDGIVFQVVMPESPYYQVSKFIPFNCRPSEAALIYWDLSKSIRRKERYAESRMAGR